MARRAKSWRADSRPRSRLSARTLQPCQTSSKVGKLAASKCGVALLKYFARTGQHEQHKDYWQGMKIQYDCAVKFLYEDMSHTGITRKTFIKAHLKMLALYLPTRVLEDLKNAGDNVTAIPKTVLAAAEGCLFGKAMYGENMLQIKRILFQDEILEFLTNLEHHDFMAEEVEVYERTMKAKAATLYELGLQRNAKTKSALTFLTKICEMTYESADDDWVMALRCSLKNIGVNTGKFSFLPWEALLFDQGHIGSLLVVRYDCTVFAESRLRSRLSARAQLFGASDSGRNEA